MVALAFRNRIARSILPLLMIGLGAGCSADPDGGYLPGGRNIEAANYFHTEGSPPFPDRAAYLGTIRGNWFEMGHQFGARAGESSRFVSDKWWREMCEMYGREESLRAFELYESQVEMLDPGLVDFMRGLAAGASGWLDESPYAASDHPLHATNYQRVLAVNFWDEWGIMHPHRFPDGTTTFGGTVEKPPVLPHMAGCSAFAVRGPATSRGEVITAHNRHSPYDPRCYEQAFVLEPHDGTACWVLTNSPQVAANQVVNADGVSLVLLAGGMTNPVSLGHPEGPFEAESFGVPWFHLFLWVGTHARTAEEAIDLLTRGTEGYRARSGRDSLQRSGGWVFMVTDSDTLAVVEATANRYAVRYAGAETVFTGADWRDPNFVVATNHYICDFSYDEHNRRSDVPMSIFNEGWVKNRETGEIIALTESGVRFWTLMWDMRHNYGRIDRFRAQQIMSGLYAHDQQSGERIEVAQDEDGIWQLFGRVKFCTAGRDSFAAGTCDSKIAVVDGSRTSIFWTMGSPIHWQGAWDRYEFD